MLHLPGSQWSLITDNWETNIDPNAPGGCNADPTAIDLYDADGTTNSQIAKDACMMELNYYSQGGLTDYTPIVPAVKTSAMAPGLPIADNHPLFNGNISSMAVNIRKLAAVSATGGAAAGPLLYNYRYDQLNRITKMDAFAAVNSDYVSLTALNEVYKERISYDPNGNITTYQRNGTGIQTAMDQMAYKYLYRKVNNTLGEYDPALPIPTDAAHITNQLASVRDAVGPGNYPTDIDDQAAQNYKYDAIGNTMAVYEAIRPTGVQNGNLTQKEVHLYGSSRLGVINYALNCSNGNNGPTPLLAQWDATFTRGDKLFELSNHLGNVLVTVTNKKLPVPNAANTEVTTYLPDISTATDYYPGGMTMPGRSYNSGGNYRFGFNGKENDKDISEGGQDYGMRIYDTRLVRFLSIDPLTKKYPFYTPYQFSGNSPILSVDIDGMEGDKNVNPVETGGQALKLSTGLFNTINNYGQWAVAAGKTPKLTFTNSDMVNITATVIGETGNGALQMDQMKTIGWVYYNRIANKNGNVHQGLTGSYAYRKSGGSTPSLSTMVTMVGLGDPTYANQSAEKQYGLKTVGDIAKVSDAYVQGYINTAKSLKAELTTAFSNPASNPIPGFKNQGYYADLNKDGDAMWTMARQYFWLQQDGKVPNDFNHTFVAELRTPGAERFTLFAFNLEAIEKYFKANPAQLPKDVKDIPDYNPVDGSKTTNVINK